MELTTRSSTRNRMKPSIFTPSKYETFSLNKKKAMNKKLEQCNRRDDILIIYKHGNYILELSLAAYELLKVAMIDFFSNHSMYTVQAKDQKDKNGLCTRTSCSVIKLSDNKQQYRINLFHTTSRIEVNGNGREDFLPHLQEMAVLMDRKGNCSQINRLLEQQIKQCMDKLQTESNRNQDNSGDASLDKHIGNKVVKASGDASLVTEMQHKAHSASGDASLDARIEHKTSGDASLVTEMQHNAHSASGDASLDARIEHKTSGDTSLVTEMEHNTHSASGDASLDARIEHETSGDASLVTEMQHSAHTASGDASLDARIEYKTSASGDASLVARLEHKTSGDASLVKLIKQKTIKASGETSLAGEIHEALSVINCSICGKVANDQLAPTYFCCKCEQTIHVHCKKKQIIPVENTNDDYICFSCTQLDQTIPDSQDHNMADLILQEQIDSRIEVHSAETNNIPRNDETANKAFDDETIVKVPIKQKTKRGQKTKEISGQEKHLEDQLIQCKARIAMLEDVNRDYKNTINLLRSQLEIKNVMGNNNGHEQCPCNKTQTNTESYIEGKLDSIFERIKHEFEIREGNLRHQLEVMELKNKVVMLEMQQAITEKLYKQNDQVPIINKAEAESSKATTDHTNREHHRCSSINHKLVDQSVDILTSSCGLTADAALVYAALRKSGLVSMDVPAVRYF